MDTAIRSARGKGTDAQFFGAADPKRGEVSRSFASPPRESDRGRAPPRALGR